MLGHASHRSRHFLVLRHASHRPSGFLVLCHASHRSAVLRRMLCHASHRSRGVLCTRHASHRSHCHFIVRRNRMFGRRGPILRIIIPCKLSDFIRRLILVIFLAIKVTVSWWIYISLCILRPTWDFLSGCPCLHKRLNNLVDFAFFKTNANLLTCFVVGYTYCRHDICKTP